MKKFFSLIAVAAACFIAGTLGTNLYQLVENKIASISASQSKPVIPTLLCDELPADVPIYPAATVINVDNCLWHAFDIKTSQHEIFAWYEERLMQKGWRFYMNENYNDIYCRIYYKSGQHGKTDYLAVRAESRISETHLILMLYPQRTMY